jgi:methyl-accepting chemotaxis protein
MSNYKRKNYFIKKNFQGKLILGYFLFMLAGCLIFVVALSWLASDSMTVVYNDNELQIGQTPFMLMKQVIAANWFAIVVGGVLVVTVATRITHRMAGPLFNLERSLDKMIAGKLNTVIYLRKNDEGQEIAEKINKYNAELGSEIKKIRKRSQNITDLLARYAALNIDKISQEDCESIYTSVLNQNEAIQDIIKQYTLPDE